MESAAAVWSNILVLMEKELTRVSINTWFQEMQILAIEGNRVTLYSPSIFLRDIIVSRYVGVVQNALRELFSADFEVTILAEEELALFAPKGQDKFLPGTDEYTFDRFVVGNSNKLAHAAARAVAEKPGESYNPLFIYGESGLRKTHLLYAVAHYIHENNPTARIVYIRGDSFTNDLVDAIRNNTNQEFRDKYRRADVFLMDDVQFIVGKGGTEEEMFHTFNALYEEKKQIIFTADRPPKEMSRLTDRLKTRFEWGLTTPIQAPDYETRMAIIKNKAQRMGVDLPEAVLTYVAENVTANVRQLEGTVNKILAFRDLLGNNVDDVSVTRAVQDMFKNPSSIMPTADVIVEEVCKFYNIDDADIRGQGRSKDTALARQVAMDMIRHITNLSLKEIGREFGNRDHTTVMHSLTRIDKLKMKSPEIGEAIKDIRTNINARYE
jgi:chromosomal replication initiator protein